MLVCMVITRNIYLLGVILLQFTLIYAPMREYSQEIRQELKFEVSVASCYDLARVDQGQQVVQEEDVSDMV
jgi:hypothetical protein